MCFFVVAVGFDVFVHLFNFHVSESRVEQVHTGQFDLSLITLDCGGDHPVADVLSEWSFASISCSRVCQLRVFERSHQRPHFDSQISFFPSCVFLYDVKEFLGVIFLLFFLLLLCRSFFRVVLVAVMLVVEGVGFVVCL